MQFMGCAVVQNSLSSCRPDLAPPQTALQTLITQRSLRKELLRQSAEPEQMQQPAGQSDPNQVSRLQIPRGEHLAILRCLYRSVSFGIL